MKIKCTLYSVPLFPSNGKKNTQKMNKIKNSKRKDGIAEKKGSGRPNKKEFFEITDYITMKGRRAIASGLFYTILSSLHRTAKVFLECIWKCHYFYYNGK